MFKKILIVEDDPTNLEVFSRVLEEGGYSVVGVTSGEEALEKCSPETDCVLIDMGLPRMDGFETTRRLRAKGYSGFIVALTGHTALRDKALEAGCSEFVTKPLKAKALKDVMRNLFI
jgi:CheY-like chemotaxis protein